VNEAEVPQLQLLHNGFSVRSPGFEPRGWQHGTNWHQDRLFSRLFSSLLPAVILSGFISNGTFGPSRTTVPGAQSLIHCFFDLKVIYFDRHCIVGHFLETDMFFLVFR